MTDNDLAAQVLRDMKPEPLRSPLPAEPDRHMSRETDAGHTDRAAKEATTQPLLIARKPDDSGVGDLSTERMQFVRVTGSSTETAERTIVVVND